MLLLLALGGAPTIASATELASVQPPVVDSGSQRAVATVEGPVFPTRAEAARHAQRVRQAGHRAEIHRTYAHSQGWQWHVVVRVPDRAQASSVAGQLTQVTGQPHSAFVAGPSARTLLSPAALRVSARRANGPLDGLERVASADELVFRYLRTLPDGRELRHVYVRRAGEVAVSVQDATTGDVVVRVRLRDGVAERASGEDWVPADVHRVRELTDQLAPEQVLRAALVLPQALVERRELVLARPMGEGPEGVRYVYGERDQGGAFAELFLQPETGRVTRLSLGTADGVLTRELEGLAADAVVPVPQRIRTTLDGRLVDDVRVEVLALETPRSAGALTEPGS